jgi:hypothetical protein
MSWPRAFLTLFAVGATLGSALDAIHTHFGATAYTHPVLFRAAWWVPLLFGFAYPIGLLAPLVDRRPPRGKPIAAMGSFVIAYWLSVLPAAWTTVAAILFVLFALSWWVLDRTVAGLVIALLAAIGGPAVESALVWAETFVHLQETAFRVPGWLPFLYLNAAVGLQCLARSLRSAASRSS